MANYKIWTDSESHIDFPSKEFDNIDEACNEASYLVHQHDNKPWRAIMHVEDLKILETIDTYENIIKQD